ncbi:MAG: hypothetical protein JJU46_14720 [Balneolaceae bacterium]|nr:hypothetical protein [Balneolaceae bacterium]
MILLYMAACDKQVSPGLEDSFELFTGLEAISEAENTTLLINEGSNPNEDGYFRIDISNVMPNAMIDNSSVTGWCLEWNKPIRSSNDTHDGVKAYATGSNDRWKPLNYLFSIENELKAKYPEEGVFTYREMQAVIWTLTGYMGIAPEFDVDRISDRDLPARLRENGTANFDREVVTEISQYVLENYSQSTISVNGIALQTADDEQNIYVVPPSGITTAPVTDITSVSARSGGQIENSGSSEISRKGVCWDTSPNPTTDDNCSDDGTGVDDYTSNISGLTPATMYYVRAYAVNADGTAYGNQRTFTTETADEVDRELSVCGTWSVSQSGGFGITVDTWDISSIPEGATFSMRFQAFTQPDKFQVEYPVGNEVHDTGWRGAQSYLEAMAHLFPGGWSGPGQGQVDDIFQKGQNDTFRVIVTGPEAGTLWNYSIRCDEEAQAI